MKEEAKEEIGTKETKGNREVRDSFFRILFDDEENFKELYKELTNKKLKGKLIRFNTEEVIEKANLINDVSFMTEDNRAIIMVEHQSTINNNMALRCCLYYFKMVEQYIKEKELNVYGVKPIQLPKPEFYIAYNGKDNLKKEDLKNELKLNIGKSEVLKAKAKVIDINYEKLHIDKTEEEKEKLSKGNTLLGYSYFTKMYEYYKIKEKYEIKEAITKAMECCMEKGVLEEYLGRKGFLPMIVSTYTIEDEKKDLYEYGIEQGREEERKELIKNMFELGMKKEDVAKLAEKSGISSEKFEEIAKEFVKVEKKNNIER